MVPISEKYKLAQIFFVKLLPASLKSSSRQLIGSKTSGNLMVPIYEISLRPMCSNDSAIQHLPDKNFVDSFTIHIHDFEAQAVLLKMIGGACPRPRTTD
jgi:hypothetical protein